MTFDLTKPADGLTVEERLALLEARLAPAPQVVVPPITVGSLTNVPVPGGQIAAQWAQDVSSIALHRFASKASLDAWAAPAGAYAVTSDTSTLWRRVGGAWSQVTPWGGNAVGIALNGQNPGTASSLNIPADPGPRVANISCFLAIDVFAGNYVMVELRFNGFAAARAYIPVTNQLAVGGGQNMSWNISLQAQALAIPANTVTPVAVVVIPNAGTTGSGIYHTTANYYENRLDCTVLPRGA